MTAKTQTEAYSEIQERLALDGLDESLARKYQANQLSTREVEEFELWLAEHPDLLFDLSADLALDHYLAAETGFAPGPSPRKTDPSKWLTGSLLAAAAAAAAIVGLGTLLVSASRENQQLQAMLEASRAISDKVDLVYLETMRSGEIQPTRVSASEHSLVYASVPVNANDSYRLVITQPDGEAVGELSGLKSDNGEVKIYIPSGFLPTGDLVIEVFTAEESTPTVSYSVVAE